MIDEADIPIVADDLRRLGKEDGWLCATVGADIIDQLRQQLAATIAERERAVKNDERLREWVCHNGGLIETWAQEWIPRGGRETLTAFIRRRLDAAIAAGGEGAGS